MSEPSAPPSNEELAARLGEVAELLEARRRTPSACARGARGRRRWRAWSGRWRRCTRRRTSRACAACRRGPELARRIHEVLDVDDLEELERAAHDGRLARVPGMGPRRVRAVRETLAGRFRRRGGRGRPATDEPSVEELLDVDAEYRDRAGRGLLPRIAPRRQNPGGEAWLPVLHTRRGRRHYTALFSNTARAHELGRTRDWVVIYRDDPVGRGQWTVVTARAGDLPGRRVVRGRESEGPDSRAGG